MEKWWLISDEIVKEIKELLNNYIAYDGEGMTIYDMINNMKKIHYKLDTGLHITKEVPDDYKELDK